MGVLFLNGGLYTTVQDLGRTGFQDMGFSVSGVMDRRSFLLANLLVDNAENEASLEFTMVGPTLKFTSDTIIAITGGDFSPRLNDKPVSMYTAIYVHKGDVLKLSYAKSGSWGYIAFSSRLAVPVVMGSRSTNTKSGIGGFHGRTLKRDDQIWFRTKKRYLPYFLSRKIVPDDFSKETETIRVVMGPQEEYFSKQGKTTFLNSEYTITSECDRMGYRLEGEYIAHNEQGADIISDGIALGAIQIPSHGKPIIMLADRQTTGGYTKIANVISVDLSKLVQRKEGHKIRFQAVGIEEAQSLYREELHGYDEIRKKIHHPCGEVLDPRITAKRLTKLFKNNAKEVERWI